ncbi:ferric-dicitrate binding protein FerR, regulates iron transport through sigma-19 [Chitinophaga eiseniae]|uniref:Ferric-dicitrate binding protein FerR, regulates iron transport through sigma-19 n=1 Tax=Chitinophaga eiseniae TaxID=634771 RepID=A0A1T4U572_9BACT|nr:FecR family protein [Chitinophaga eiseniae]SKA47807.1 ferric-dicitrate binding protein FerR, regulates iron transport through sigma-19 [Chitinophaga eiseniae]
MSQEKEQSRYEVLAEKWLKGTITPEEAQEYAAWYNAGQDDAVEIPVSFAASEAEQENRIWNQIAARTGIPGHTATVAPSRRRRWWAAAAVTAAIVTAGYCWHHWHTKTPLSQQMATIVQDAAPGSDKAVLTLSNGRQILLDSAGNGALAQQGGVRIIKKEDGSILYVDEHSGALTDTLYNIMSVPKGGQYKLVLPDGSRVWLNAASSLKYPVVFSNRERSVELNGEGYFEVAASASSPFSVKVRNTQIAVLGTSFNIMGYADENGIHTTLLNGAVKVKQGTTEKILAPGQQAVVNNENGHISVGETETTLATAWKDGQFRFSGNNIPMVLRQISRWYNIDIVYQGSVPQGHITGKVPRNMKLSGVIRILELSGIRCKQEAGRLLVFPSS